MTLTPQDIQSQQFHVRFRGFDAEEVDSFLERVAEEFLLLQEENKELATQVENLKKEITAYQNQERAFKKAIMSAQQIAEEMKAKSQQEAVEIAAAARREAQQLREEANAEIVSLESEVDRLKGLRSQTKEELRQMLQAYLARLDETFEPGAGPIDTGDRWQSPPVPEGEAPEEEEESPVVDLSDLYEKIELPEEAAGAALSEGEIDRTGEIFDMEAAEEAPDTSVPDLEGDLLFTLEDPLDEEEPAVTFETGEPEELEPQEGKERQE